MQLIKINEFYVKLQEFVDIKKIRSETMLLLSQIDWL